LAFAGPTSWTRRNVGDRRNETELRDRNSEFRGANRDSEVAGGRDYAAAANRVALDHRDDWLRHRTQCRLELLGRGVVVERAFSRGQVLAEFAYVGARDEDPVAGTGENKHPHSAIFGKSVQGLCKQARELEAERIAHVRTIDRQPGDRIAVLDQESLRHA
jgi:hypothetical protein